MARLVLLRHGSTPWSEAKRLQGRADVPLSPQGRAAVTGWELPPEFARFTRVTSPLRRCVETAELLQPRARFAIEPRLIEMDFGAWEGMTLAEVRGRFGPAAADRERRGLNFRAPGGESPRDVQLRLRPLLEVIGTRGTDLLGITHKGVIRATYALATGWPMLGKAPERLRWDCLHLFAVHGDGSVAVEALNVPLATRERPA